MLMMNSGGLSLFNSQSNCNVHTVVFVFHLNYSNQGSNQSLIPKSNFSYRPVVVEPSGGNRSFKLDALACSSVDFSIIND